MSGRVKSLTNPQNVSSLIMTEPSQYLDSLKVIITDKQKKLSESSLKMQKSVEKLETNIDLMKQRLSTLEMARSKLEEEFIKNNELLKKTQDSSSTESLEKQNKELLEEKEKIESEMSKKLVQINDLENSIENKDKEWNENKKELVQRLKQFQEQELLPYLNNIENIMEVTNSKIEASNTKLTKYMTGEMEFGTNDPFLSIGRKFNEKFTNNNNLFGDNNFGKAPERPLYSNKNIENNMNFGKNEDDIDVEEIGIIEDTDNEDDDEYEYDDDDEDDSESDSDNEEMNFGTLLDEESDDSMD